MTVLRRTELEKRRIDAPLSPIATPVRSDRADPLPDAPLVHARGIAAAKRGGLGAVSAREAIGGWEDLIGPAELCVVKTRELGAIAKSAESSLAALSSPDFYVRRAGVETLIRRGSERGWLPRLIDFIERPIDRGRTEWATYHAVASLARIAQRGDAGAIAACLSLLGRGFDQEVGLALQDAPAELVEATLKKALTSKDPHRKSAASHVLRVRAAAKIPSDRPQLSFPFLPLANGTTTGVLALEDGSIRTVRDTIFSNPALGASPDALERLQLTPYVDGKAIAESRIEAGYQRGSQIAFMRSEGGGIEWTRSLIAPLDEARMHVLVRAENVSERPHVVGVAASADGAPLLPGGRTLAPGQEAWFELTLDPKRLPSLPQALSPSTSDRLERERARAEDWSMAALGRLEQRQLSPREKQLYVQAQAFLRMGQAPNGAIVASIPPGHWNITWVRDMSYALVAMAESGMHAQAKRGFEFLLGQDHQTAFESFPFEGQEMGVGRPYQLSVVRYFEDGREESDEAEGSPNIEFDGFGLVPWALERYVEKSGDTRALREWWPVLRDKIGDVILGVIDETGLIQRDSSIWERHLPGRRFTYTSAACARGLTALAALAEQIGEADDAERYRTGATDLGAAIRKHLVEEKVLLGYGGEVSPTHTYDASALEAFNWGVIDVNQREGFEIAMATLAAYREHLGVPDSPGFKRTTQEGWYEEQEWIVLDLRAASLLYLMSQSPEAARRGLVDQLQSEGDSLLAWVEKHMAANHDVIAELLGNGNRLYEGAIPMVGYGPGALIMALEAKSQGTNVS